MNADKTEYIRFNQKGGIPTLNGGSLKLMDMFTYLGSRISSSEYEINMPLAIGYQSYGSLTCPIK